MGCVSMTVDCNYVNLQIGENEMTTAAWEVNAGVIPGVPMVEHTKLFPYEAEDFEADKLVPQDQPTKYSMLSEEAHLYARELENPKYLNWVQVTFTWF